MPRWFKSERNKEQQRFYLLPGQGGKAYRRKQRLILLYALVVGLLVSAIIALAMYWVYHTPK